MGLLFFALIATAGMGTANFLFGYAAREVDPLMINWFTSAFMMIATLLYLIGTARMHRMYYHVRHNTRLILGVGAVDNMAWVAYAWSTLHLPIGIATAFSETYIVLAAFLGVTFNRERLQAHQIVGFLVAIISVLILATTVT